MLVLRTADSLGLLTPAKTVEVLFRDKTDLSLIVGFVQNGFRQSVLTSTADSKDDTFVVIAFRHCLTQHFAQFLFNLSGLLDGHRGQNGSSHRFHVLGASTLSPHMFGAAESEHGFALSGTHTMWRCIAVYLFCTDLRESPDIKLLILNPEKSMSRFTDSASSVFRAPHTREHGKIFF
jgi:hypothetical protein